MMSIIRPKNGYPNRKFFESIETLNQFDIIRKNLQKIEQNSLTKENLAQLVIQLLRFQEDLFGKQSNGSITRIPVNTKKDFCLILIISLFLLDGMFSGFS
jgi:SWI/SNF related-matrix-associated actin-dependent regulator of chromatin subfamily C